jgi:NDP-sugar pyrophosphorylase family protein
MKRHTVNIKKVKVNKEESIAVAILAAGSGKKIKSYEPRSLIKISNDFLLQHQIKALNNYFDNPEIITVVGCHANRIIKRFKGKTRFVENQMFDQTNSSESLRLAFNNSSSKHLMFIHGDVLFNTDTISLDYSRSFVIKDINSQLKDTEVGLTEIDNELSIMSYGLKDKWAQIAYFTGKEYEMLKCIFNKFETKDKKKLSFEIINEILAMGGSFACLAHKKMNILEIDRIKDIK